MDLCEQLADLKRSITLMSRRDLDRSIDVYDHTQQQ